MKAFILAAGDGTRLRPLTNSTPKCLVPVRGRPLLGIWLELCKRAGIRDLLVNVHAHAQSVRDFVSNLPNDVHVTVFEEPDLLGGGGTIAANRKWVAGEPYFWVLYADVLTNVALMPMLEFHHARNSAVTIGVYQVQDPKRCGIVRIDPEHRVTEFVEKPENPSGNLAFSGVLVGTPSMLSAIPDGGPRDLGRDILPHLTGQMSAYEIHEFLMDIGTPENYREAQATWPGLS